MSAHLSCSDIVMCVSTELYIAVVMSCDSLFLKVINGIRTCTSFVSIHTFVLCRLSDVVVLRCTLAARKNSFSLGMPCMPGRLISS